MELKKVEKASDVKDEKGATMVEYAMMVALIAAVCIVAITNIGKTGNAAFSRIATQMNSSLN